MITNDAELEVVRTQVARLDAAVEDLRRNVLPKSEQMFNLFAEAPLDMRQELQTDIDAYLRAKTASANGPTGSVEPLGGKALEPAGDDPARGNQVTGPTSTGACETT
jgi:hypothetical protein